MNSDKIINQNEFIESISNKLRRPFKGETFERPERIFRPELKVLSELSEDELLDVFKKENEKNHTEVIETNQLSLKEDLSNLLHKHGEGPVVIPDDSRFNNYGLQEIIQADYFYKWDLKKGKENITIAETAKTGVMFSDLTLAESATVVVLNDAQIARSISLLPDTFIAIIPKSTLVPRFTQLAAKLDEEIERGNFVPSCVNLISGPSNSADIEYTFVVGVHGPVKASYIVVKDL